MDLNERLIAARKHAGFDTAAEAAEALGVPYPTYAGHENGSSGFRADKGELYSRRFKVHFEWLMRGRGPMIGAEGAETQLRLAALAMGVHRDSLDQLVTFVEFLARSSPDAQSKPDDAHDLLEHPTARHEVQP